MSYDHRVTLHPPAIFFAIPTIVYSCSAQEGKTQRYMSSGGLYIDSRRLQKDIAESAMLVVNIFVLGNTIQMELLVNGSHSIPS